MDSSNREELLGISLLTPQDSTGGQTSTRLADVVLRLIWQERTISRAEIARVAGLSRSTVSEIVAQLLPTGLVAETGVGPSRGGRPPIVLEFQDRAGGLLGVEMGASHVAVALTDLRGHVLFWREEAHDVRSDPEGTRALIRDLCESCIGEWEHGTDRLVGLGVALPSPLDPRNPDHLSEVVLPDWKGTSGLGFLSDHFGVPLFLDNDANLGALAERWWGAGRGVDNFVYVKIATGIGAGYVVDGSIYRGASGVAGEIGHLVVDPSGGPCVCGLRGCLATFVGSQALVERARKLIPRFPDTALDPKTLTIVGIEDAALAGDALATQLAQEAAEHLGVAVAGLLNLMNPSSVILGGELARLGKLLLDPLQETVHRRTLVSSLAGSEVRISELGPRTVAVGAATLALQAALTDPRLLPTALRQEAT